MVGDVVKNYYTGEDWELVSERGGETWVKKKSIKKS